MSTSKTPRIPANNDKKLKSGNNELQIERAFLSTVCRDNLGDFPGFCAMQK